MAEIRKYAVERFQDIFHDINLSRKMEISIYNYTNQRCRKTEDWDNYFYRKVYIDKLRMLIENVINPACNIKDTLSQHTDPKLEDEYIKSLPLMTHIDFAPQNWNYSFKPIEKPPTTEESQVKCNNCARKGLNAFNTSYYEKQTRSADEPTTIYASCNTCGKTWRFS